MFGIDEKMKRGFVVPVIAIAVCAVAMIGVGFAATVVNLESNVISDENVTAELMLDMGGKGQYNSLESADLPGEDININELLKITLTNTKEGMTNTFAVTGGWAYIKVFGNLDTSYFTLGATVRAAGTGITGSATPTIGLTMYEIGDNGAISGIATMNNGTFTTTGKTDGKSIFECETVYIVAVTELNGVKIGYSGTAGTTENITATVDENNSTSTISGAQNWSVEYTFTAEASLTPANNPAPVQSP